MAPREASMRFTVRVFATALLVAASVPADAAALGIATRNLGWHVTQSELSSWIAHCSQTLPRMPKACGEWSRPALRKPNAAGTSPSRAPHSKVCPDAPLTRGQMAVFLSKGLGL